jgi:hypothetical protein
MPTPHKRMFASHALVQHPASRATAALRSILSNSHKTSANRPAPPVLYRSPALNNQPQHANVPQAQAMIKQ